MQEVGHVQGLPVGMDADQAIEMIKTLLHTFNIIIQLNQDDEGVVQLEGFRVKGENDD